MLRQASSRSQRSKGFKIKHALQITLLIAVCIWLLYQVKHSHEKEKHLLERRSASLSNNIDKKDDFFKFGRKDLPQIEDAQNVAENDETQEEEIEEDQDTRQDESVNEIEIDEEKESKEDDIDEHDQEKGDEEEESEHADESTEEEDKDNINGSNNIEEEKDEHGEVDIFDNNQELEGSTQEAREENYKRDDASSAVVHEAHTTESETGAIIEKNIDEEPTVDKIVYDSDARGVNATDANTESSANKNLESDTVKEKFEKKTLETAVPTNGTEYVDNVYVNETAQINSTNEVEVRINSTISDSTESQYISNITTALDEDAVKLQTTQSEFDFSANNTVVAGGNETMTRNNNVVINSTITEEDQLHNTVNPDENTNTTSENVDERTSETSEISDNLAHDDGIAEEESDDRIDMSTLPQVQNEVMTSYEDAEE